jgi:GntR family transcriptional regulator
MSTPECRPTREAVAYERRRRELGRAGGGAFVAGSSARQTYDFLRTRLAGLAPGDVLVEADLMRSLAASRGAVRSALQRLADEGLVSRKTKLGTRVERFVQLPFSHLLPDKDKPTFDMTVAVKTSIVPAPSFLQEVLGVSPDSSVAMVDGQMFYGALPIGLSVGYVPLTVEELARGAELERSTLGTIDFIEKRLGAQLQFSRATLGALVCDDETAARLSVAPGSPMMWLEQVLVDVDGNDRGLYHARYRADRVGFSGHMQRQHGDASPWSTDLFDHGATGGQPA